MALPILAKRPPETLHAWVSRGDLPKWLEVGWSELKSLDGTHHGQWAVHCIWDRPSEPVLPAWTTIIDV